MRDQSDIGGSIAEETKLFAFLTDCLAHFDTVRVGLEIILDEKLERVEKQEKLKKAQQLISDLQGKLKK